MAALQETRSGFTLVELVAVLVVVGILAVTIHIGFGTNASLSAEADMLRMHLRYAQSMAMANNIYAWSISFDNQGYTLRRDDLPSPVPWPGVHSATHLFPAEIALAQGAGVLSFDAWGVPPAGYTVVLSDGDRNAQVDILALTGLVP